MESEWRKLRTLSWKELFLNDDNSCNSSSAIEFWFKISQIKNAVGQSAFLEISKFALRALSLPVSNAVVERVFSVMAVVKTKIRIRMGFSMLTNICLLTYFEMDAQELNEEAGN